MKLNHKIQGKGEPLVLIHGLFGSLSNLSMVAKSLSEHFRVYSVDLRNHGASDHSDDMDYPEMAADIIEFMDEQKLEQAPLLGHSMGGKTAMQVAMNYPDRVNRLVVADIAPVVYSGHHSDVFTGLLAIPVEQIKSRREAENILIQHVTEVDVRSFLLKNLARNENGQYQWRLNLPVIHRDYDKIAGAPTGPTYQGPALFIKGGNSNYMLAKHREDVLRLFPQAELKVIENTGHWLHAEKPSIFNALALRFLQDTI